MSMNDTNDRARGARHRAVSQNSHRKSTNSGRIKAIRGCTAFLALALCFAALPALAAFGPGEQLFPGIIADAIAVGDVDGDGRDDIVMLVRGNGNEPTTVRISLQRPDGTLETPATVALDDPPLFNEVIRLVDMTADGLPDIVVGAYDGVWVLTNRGGLQFTTQVVFAEPVSDLAADDFDGDGHRDLIAASSGSFVILHGDGAGGVSKATSYPGYLMSYFQLVDAEGDGDLDIAFLEGDRIRILERDATGFTGASRSSVVPIRGEMPSTPAFADFNGDGLVDYAIGKHTNSYFNPVVALVIQRPGGRFQQLPSLRTLDLPDNLFFHDLDGDGDLDLIVPHPGWGDISVYRSNGRNLQIEERYSSYSARSPHAMDKGDLNGDGLLDIVSASHIGGLQLLPGRADVPGADPRVRATVDAAAATIRLGNDGDRITTASVFLEVDLEARRGGVQAGKLPQGCDAQPWDNAGVRITCFLPPLAAGADLPLVLPLAGIDANSLNHVWVDARLFAGEDVRPDNNRSRTRGLVLPGAKRATSLKPTSGQAPVARTRR